MASKLELSLEDIVKQNKKGGSGRGRGGRGGFRGRGGNKVGRGGNKPAAGGIKRLNSQSPMKGRGMGGGQWKHDLSANGGGGNAAPAGPARLAISNLDFGVNDQDINELFSRCGKIIKAHVHYDANGRSQGTADVVYRSHKEALSAVNEYNGRLLDGRPMNVAVVGGAPKLGNLASRVGAAPNRGGFAGKRRGGGRFSAGGAANGGARGRGGLRRGGRGGQRGAGRGGRGGGAPLSKEDLDKQMEEYRMQTDTA